MDASETDSMRHPRPAYFWLLGPTAVIAAALGAVATLMIDREHRWGVGLWLSDFAKSPGLAGMSALIAAVIAFIGISRQVRVSRVSVEMARTSALEAQTHAQESLEHQRAVEQDRAWWKTFEWASSRAIPSDKSAEPLPYVAVLNTFQALADSATDDVQRAAIAGVMDVAAKRAGETIAADGSSDSDGVDGDATEQLRSALSAYVATTANTPARSRAAEYQLYELDVLKALARVEGGSVRVQEDGRSRQSSSGFRPDAIVEVDGNQVIVELKLFREPSAKARYMALETLRRIRGTSLRQPILLISPMAPKFGTDVEAELSFRAVSWKSPSDDAALRRALLEVAGLRPWEPHDAREL